MFPSNRRELAAVAVACGLIVFVVACFALVLAALARVDTTTGVLLVFAVLVGIVVVMVFVGKAWTTWWDRQGDDEHVWNTPMRDVVSPDEVEQYRPRGDDEPR